MSETTFPAPSVRIDAGALGVGTGLLMLIRESLEPAPAGTVAAIRTTDPGVAHDLPAWCRIMAHAYLGSATGPDGATYYIYAHELLPTLDTALSALLDDLQGRGLLDSTLVVATGEFGRTPRLNAAGGRDHWPGVWSAAIAGGGTRGGQVLGASDAQAASPADRPVTPAELVATMYQGLRIDPTRCAAWEEDPGSLTAAARDVRRPDRRSLPP